MTSSALTLRLDALHVARGERLLMADLDLALQPGEALWVQGENGSGKSSLLRLLAGLTLPRSGVVQRPLPLIYIGHRPGLKDELTPLENLRWMAKLAGRPSGDAEALQALSAVGLRALAFRELGTLSEGQQRRVALAQLWLPDAPRLWLLDEPLAALDASLQQRLAARLREHLDAGGLLVFSSHQSLDVGLPIRQLQLQGGARAWTLH